MKDKIKNDIKDNMKGEYIIINKASLKKELTNLLKQREVEPDNYQQSYLNGKIKQMQWVLSQKSTPLIPKIEKSQNEICDILLKPMEQLKPLEDLWRKENSPDKFIAPDTTQFFIWIREKILNANK